MLDENLPSFYFKASADDPLSTPIFFTSQGSEPIAEYLFKRAEPAAARGRYAVALSVARSPEIVYAEVLVDPEWQTPTLSTAEIRANRELAAAPTPLVPDAFSIRLYDPDLTVPVKMSPSTWNRVESWEFEVPIQSFRMPSASQVDQQEAGPAASPFAPKMTFRWKKDGRLSKDMTCYNVGRSLGKHRSKDPDITVALFKSARDSALTIYEPNLQRVDVEDRKGLEIVLVLSAAVIRDLYLIPKQDIFNLVGAASDVAAGWRKNSKPVATSSSPPPGTSMSGALGGAAVASPVAQAPLYPPPSHRATVGPGAGASVAAIPPTTGPSSAEVEAETKRLQALMLQEKKEREKREREEQKRIKKMLDDEEKERRRREAEVAKETERLRKIYGTQGQELPSSRPAAAGASPPPGPHHHHQNSHNPSLPPRPSQSQHLAVSGGPAGQQPPPPRPVSAGPLNNSKLSGWWNGSGNGPPAQAQAQQQQQPQYYYQPPQDPPPLPGPRPNGSSPGPYAQNPSASFSTFFRRDRRASDETDGRKVQKKRSTHF